MTEASTEAPKVYSAIAAVQGEIAKVGISKGRKNQQQGYSFRGIDDIYGALASLLSSNGLCILPRALSRECVERQTAKGSAIFYVTVEVEFDFVSVEDGSRHVVKTYGEAMDSADKATNKAMSAAYKYACLQAFCIPTEGDNDADATTHEVSSKGEQTKPDPKNDAALSSIQSKLDGFTTIPQVEEWEKKATPAIALMPALYRGRAERLVSAHKDMIREIQSKENDVPV